MDAGFGIQHHLRNDGSTEIIHGCPSGKCGWVSSKVTTLRARVGLSHYIELVRSPVGHLGSHRSSSIRWKSIYFPIHYRRSPWCDGGHRNLVGFDYIKLQANHHHHHHHHHHTESRIMLKNCCVTLECFSFSKQWYWIIYSDMIGYVYVTLGMIFLNTAICSPINFIIVAVFSAERPAVL